MRRCLNAIRSHGLLSVTLWALLQGCVSGPPDISVSGHVIGASGQTTQRSPAQSIALDFVSTLQSLLPNDVAVLQVSEYAMGFHRRSDHSDADHQFYNALYALLEDRGYALQQVSHDQGRNTLAARVSPTNSFPDTNLSSYALSIGPLTLTRRYRHGDIPTAADPFFTVEVVQALADKTSQAIVANVNAETMRNAMLDQRFVRVLPIGKDQFLPRSHGLDTTASSVIPEIVLLNSPVSVRTEYVPERQGVNAFNMSVNNLYYTNQTNFTALLTGYNEAVHDMLEFSGQQMALTEQHHTVLADFLKNFDASTDVITLMGSSTVPTDYPGGNRALAMGRSALVVEYLLAAGVSRTRILEEGCWSDHEIVERYPASAVVTTIHRKVL